MAEPDAVSTHSAVSAGSAVSLTRDLLRFDTINPPGQERDCAQHAGALLEKWGFQVQYHEYADRRTSLVARAGGSDAKPPLCVLGILPTCPTGSTKKHTARKFSLASPEL